MRIVQATIQDAYKVHKTVAECLHDLKIPVIENELYLTWTEKLTNENFKYLMLMHGKKIVGMVWGHIIPGEIEPSFLLEGKFLRRAYRGKFKFTRELLQAVKDISKDFKVVRMLLPKRPGKLPGKYLVLGTLVQLK